MSEPSIPTPVVSIVDNVVSTTSLAVAEFFGKLHKDVIRTIRNLIDLEPKLNQRNFAPVEIPDAKNEKRPAYLMDRKGFTLLAMGFTGEKALQFKIAYIDAFDAMERQLYGKSETLTPAQQLKLRNAVAGRAHRKPENYQKIYRELKAHFQVAKYSQIPQIFFDEALEVIDAVELVPTLPPPQKVVEENTFVVTQDFLERLRSFTYCWRYLYRDELERFCTLMRLMNSPHAPRLHEAIKDLNLAQLERNLEELGFPVKDLRSYKALMLQRK